MQVNMPEVNIASPETEEDFKSNIGSLLGQRNQKRAELMLLEAELSNQRQQLQIMRVQQQQSKVQK